MRPNIKYSPLHLQDFKNDDDMARSSVAGKFAFPKITRLKVIAFLVILVIAIVLITLSCLHSGYLSDASVCNLPTEKPVFPSGKDSSDNVVMPEMKQRLPQCLIIGARKAGTRALLTYLDLHPDIVTKGDEMHFFDDDEFYSQSLEAYLKQMPPSQEGQITIEKTPAYFVEPDVPDRVYRMNKTIKLLLILRDPIERAVSDWTQIAENMRLKNKPFESFEKHALNKDGSINKSYKAISRSVYHRHLTRWLELFNLQQFHIIDSEDLVLNPFKVTWGVEEFLGLEHRIKPSNFYFNETRGFHCIMSETRAKKCLKPSKGRTHPEVNPKVISKLKKYFAPHNLKLYKMIGHTFNWDE